MDAPMMKYERSNIGDYVAEMYWPAKMTPEGYQDFEEWIQLVLRKAKRSVVEAKRPIIDMPHLQVVAPTP